jgi:hypothetical protein
MPGNPSMYIRRTLFLAPIFTLLFCAVGHAGPSDNAAIRITETARAYELTVPVSRLIMTIPKGEFTHTEQDQGGAAGSPRYFAFRHKTLNLTVDGWFEPAENFPGLKKLWEEKLNVFKRTGRRPPEEVAFTKVGRWKAITYVIPDPAIPLITSEISAHWLQAGTWIELHLSFTADSVGKDPRTKLVELLKAIQVKEKK